VVETNACDFAVGCVLSQVNDKDKLLHPVAFYSRSLTTTEKNYTIYDKELLGVITAFEVWRHHLEGSKFPFQVVTDHKNLLYFKKPKNLNQRQIRWSLFLSKFDFRINFRPRTKSSKPDALSRRPDYPGSSTSNIQQTVLSENIFVCAALNSNISKLIEAQKKDSFC